MKKSSALKRNTIGSIARITIAILVLAMTISIAAGMVLIFCKAVNQTRLSWFQVFLPIIIPLGIEFVICGIFVLLSVIGVFDHYAKEKEIGA